VFAVTTRPARAVRKFNGAAQVATSSSATRPGLAAVPMTGFDAAGINADFSPT